MHRRKNYRKPVMTKLPASVGITMIGDVGMTGAILVVVVVAVVQDAVNSARSVEPVVVEEIASVVSAVVGDATAIAIPDHANCRSRRKACA